jgi:hypothetical protein
MKITKKWKNYCCSIKLKFIFPRKVAGADKRKWH